MRNSNENYSNGTNVTVLSTVNPSEMGNVFSYNGSNITMRNENGIVYVNLTEFAKPFPNKNLTQIINSQEISEYCNSLSKLQNYSLADLLIVRRGGNDNGTWAHQKVALRVAQKLSPDFAVWVDTKIEELLTKGNTSIQSQYNVPQSFSEALMLAAKQQQRIEEQQKLIEQKEVKITKLQPKADFAEAAFKSEGKVDIGQAAKILGLPFGRNTLFKKLKEKGILFKRNEPKQKYVDAGYFELTQLPPIHRNDHPDLIVMKVLCTQKGLAYINSVFGGNKADGKLARIV